MATPVSSSPAPFDPGIFEELFGKSLNQLIEEKLYEVRKDEEQVHTIGVLSHEIKLFVEGTLKYTVEKVSWVARIKISFDKYPGYGISLFLGKGNEPEKKGDLSELKVDFKQKFFYKKTLSPEDFPELPLTYSERCELDQNKSPLWHRVQLHYPAITDTEKFNCFYRVCTTSMHAEVALIKAAKKGGLLNRERMAEGFLSVLSPKKGHFQSIPQAKSTSKKWVDVCNKALYKPEKCGEGISFMCLFIVREIMQLQSKKREATSSATASSATASSDRPGSPKPVTSRA